MSEKTTRLFFGYSINAPWPVTYPKGRIIAEESRHITLAFLGNSSISQLEKKLPSFPQPKFLIGPVGQCDHLLFLPKYQPRVVAHHVDWFSQKNLLENFHHEVLNWLESHKYPVDRRPFLSHITIARAPFVEAEWENAFEPLPCMITGIHLYESTGNLQYRSLWEIPFTSAFEEFEHTADIAFHIRGKTTHDLYIHAAIAMSFHLPAFLNFIESKNIETMDQVISSLNQMISQCDLQIGCPFKAVSYHGKTKKLPDDHTEWEMIVDV